MMVTRPLDVPPASPSNAQRQPAATLGQRPLMSGAGVVVSDGGAVSLEPSGVSAGIYGDATHWAIVEVDDYGRVIAASEQAFPTVPSFITATISTTDATPTALASVAIPAATTRVINAIVSARRTGGTSGSVGDGAGYLFAVVAKNVGGAVSIISQGTQFSGEDQAAWDISASVSSTNILIEVTGAADNDVNWAATIQLQDAA